MSGDKYTLKFPSVGDTISIAKRRRSLEKYRLPESRKRKQIEESKVVYEQESEREIEDEKELEQHQNEEEGDGDGITWKKKIGKCQVNKSRKGRVKMERSKM